MSRVDYFAIEEEIKAVLEADAGLREFFPELKVAIEEEVTFGTGPQVVIYLMRREAPADEQNIAAGTETRFFVRLAVWCFASSLASLAAAMKTRDDLMGRVEVALMLNRTLNDVVGTSWLDGGEFENPQTGDVGFTSGGEVQLVARVRATT